MLTHTMGIPIRKVYLQVGAQVLSLGRPFEGWRMASKGLGPLPTMRGSALAHGYCRGGRVVLPLLANAATVSTWLANPNLNPIPNPNPNPNPNQLERTLSSLVPTVAGRQDTVSSRGHSLRRSRACLQ